MVVAFTTVMGYIVRLAPVVMLQMGSVMLIILSVLIMRSVWKGRCVCWGSVGW